MKRKRRKAMGEAVKAELHELKRKLAAQSPEMAGRDITKAFVAAARKLDDDEFRTTKPAKPAKPARRRWQYPPVDPRLYQPVDPAKAQRLAQEQQEQFRRFP
jgi:hypothetical protein